MSQYRVSFLVEGAGLALLMGVLEHGQNITLERVEHVENSAPPKKAAIVRQRKAADGSSTSDVLSAELAGSSRLSIREIRFALKKKGFSENSAYSAIHRFVEGKRGHWDGEYLTRAKAA